MCVGTLAACDPDTRIVLLAPPEVDAREGAAGAASVRVVDRPAGGAVAGPGVGIEAGAPVEGVHLDSGTVANADAGAPDAVGVASSRLVVRYDFSGSGIRLRDRVGDADGLILGGASLDGSGSLTLDGEDDYVDLPNRLISTLDSASIVVWLEWFGGICWQRVFDAGSNDGGEGNAGATVETSFFMTPLGCGNIGFSSYFEFGRVKTIASANGRLPARRLVQVGVVVDDETGTFAVYYEGQVVARAPLPARLSAIDDVNVWLGRSQWIQDRFLAGRYDEFRIYDRALSPEEIWHLYRHGPDRL